MKFIKIKFLILNLFLMTKIFADNLNYLESSINFQKPIIGGYNYKFALYLSKKDNIVSSLYNANVNVLDDSKLKLIENLNESGNYFLSKNEEKYLIKSIWSNKDLYVENIKTYSKNPTQFYLFSDVKTNKENNKSCINIFYSYTNLLSVKIEKIENEDFFIFSTNNKSTNYNCLNIKNNVYYIVDYVNYNSFMNLINNKIEKNYNNDYINDAYLLLKIEKE